MQHAYIVWNQTNYNEGFEIFGVYQSYRKALACYRRVLRKRYGKSSADDELIQQWISDGDSIMITEFSKSEAEANI